MVDEVECVASVLLAIVFGHLADARNISWAAYSGYMVMRGHISESLLRGALRIVGPARADQPGGVGGGPGVGQRRRPL
jgi:hypothetical protein